MKTSLVPYAIPFSQRSMDDLLTLRDLRTQAFKDHMKKGLKGSRRKTQTKLTKGQKILSKMPEHLRQMFLEGAKKNGLRKSIRCN